MEAVEAVGVKKLIRGREVVRDLTLTIRRGTIHFLAGPNGAGKTTSIRMILGLIDRDAGSLRVLGRDPREGGWEEVKARIGYLPEDAQPYERLTGLEHIRYFAKLYGKGEEAVRRAIEISMLGDALNRRASTYSKGMRRRLLLALAFMHEPDLVVLDEPTSGLDVVSAYRIREMLKSMRSGGTTLIITTHNMREAEELADRITFLSAGRVIADGSPGELLVKYGAKNLEEAYVRAVGHEE